MVKKLGMPKASPTMDRGALKWLIKEGDQIEAGQEYIEVSSDKATSPQPAFETGKVVKILVKDGDEADVDAPIAIVAEEGDSDEDIALAIKEAEEFLAKKKLAPEADASPGDEIPADSSNRPAPQMGGGLSQPAFQPMPALNGYNFDDFRKPAGGRINVSPLARKIAVEKGIDLATIKGSGPNGRIVEADVNTKAPDVSFRFQIKDVDRSKAPGSFVEEPLSPMRKVIGQRLQESKTFIPHFYVKQEIDMEPLFTLRTQLINTGIKLSYNDFVIKATALALRDHPHVNSGFNNVNNSITRYQTVDISIAVSMPDGLITPIVRLADQKNLGQISTEVKSLAKRAKGGSLKPEEYQGGSFTISNMGMFGVSEFAGIINPPQAGILSIGGMEEKPVVRNGEIAPGKCMTITLSADHRVVDGVDGALFIKSLQKYLENPAALLL